MVWYQRILLIVALMTAIFFYSSATAEITVEPCGFALSLEENANADIELTLSNSGEEDVAFSIEYERIFDEDDRQASPRRDDLGDVIREFDLPFNRTDGMVWDGDNLWACSYGDSRYCCFDEDFEVICNYQTAGQVVGMTWDAVDGVFWMGHWNTPEVYMYDREGEHVGTFEMPVNCNGGYATDGEYFYWISEARNFPLYKLDRDLNEVAVVPDLLDKIGHSIRVMAIEYVREHRDGRFWVTTREPGYVVQLDVDWENEDATVVQEFQIRNIWAHEGLTHDGENLYQGGYGGEQTGYVYDDGIREFDILTIDPEAGTVQGNESETVNINVNVEGYDAGVYNALISIELSEPRENRDDMEQSLIEISAIVSVGEPTYNLSGVVTEAANDAPIESAAVSIDNYHITRFTDEDGAYTIENLPAGEYMVTISAVDFLPIHREVSIENEDIELNEALRYAEFTPSRDEFMAQLEPFMDYEIEFQVTNTGNGPLSWSVERNIPEVQDIDTWEMRSSIDVQEIVGDDMLAGVVLAEGYFFVSGGNNGDDVNKIYVLNDDFEQVGEFDQFAEDRYGMRDLAYDGELIWGAVEGTFYGFTTVGELEVEIEAEADVEGRCIAWDPDSELLWTSDISTDIYGINRNGELVRTIGNDDLRIYGLAYWEDDPDDYNLYVFCRGPDNTGISVYKVNLENGDYINVTYIDVGESRPGGLYISNQFDIYSWVLIGLVQNPDILNIWQLDTNYGWFSIEPEEGVIEPDESQDFVLIFDSADIFFLDTEYEGELIYTHDGIGGETILDVKLCVVDSPCQRSRSIDLHIGWNTVSANLQPDYHEDIEYLLSDLVGNQQLIMMKNGAGDYYKPEYDFNNIPGWYCYEGYQMLMGEAATLTLVGESVLRDDPIDLTEGWQLISYYPRYEIEATDALASIYDNLIIAKDGYGNFYLPEWDDFSNMGYMCEGQGYFIKVNADCRLIYVPEEEERSAGSADNLSADQRIPACHEDQVWLSEVPRSSVSYSLLLLTEGMESGTRLEAYTPSGELAGRGVVDVNGRCGMALWGQDSGFNEGEAITIVGGLDIPPIGVEGRPVCHEDFEWLDGDITGWKADGWGVAKLTTDAEVPLEFGIVSAYPNPFNSQMRVSYNLLANGIIDLAAYDISGRRVADLTSGRQVSGVHTVMFNGKDMPSGVYMLRLQAGEQNSLMKVMLVK
ncbi:carboxypeptidase regulatory-like domain-containing protein [bacterium]|nr:carboxypeptidase regulatory-like domain-containing protein [bacterium]